MLSLQNHSPPNTTRTSAWVDATGLFCVSQAGARLRCSEIRTKALHAAGIGTSGPAAEIIDLQRQTRASCQQAGGARAIYVPSHAATRPAP